MDLLVVDVKEVLHILVMVAVTVMSMAGSHRTRRAGSLC
jgi:hypothetical protein